ncbi:MAG TPA: hypothetical protein VHJ69_07850, partial [Gemmatimonadales bacterium]|nr:hypothetical protein [Gemmatimonadales bacterium]
MRYRCFAAAGLAVCLSVAGCTDQEPPGPSAPSEPQFSHTASASCDFNFNSLISQFFTNQTRQGEVQTLRQQMVDAHQLSSESGVQKYGFNILANIEAAVNESESNNPTVGSELANRVLACMFTEAQIGSPAVTLPIDFTQELTVAGLGAFAVRGNLVGEPESYDTAGPVFAHDKFSGVTPVSGAAWSTVLSNRILIYGERATNTT